MTPDEEFAREICRNVHQIARIVERGGPGGPSDDELPACNVCYATASAALERTPVDGSWLVEAIAETAGRWEGFAVCYGDDNRADVYNQCAAILRGLIGASLEARDNAVERAYDNGLDDHLAHDCCTGRIMRADREAVEREVRNEWADYFDHWTAAVGPRPPTVRDVIDLLRAEGKPFGVSAAVDGPTS